MPGQILQLAGNFHFGLRKLRLNVVWNMTSERRDKRRFEVCLDAAWDSPGGSSNARITDLSESGCYVDSINEAFPGEILHLKVQLPTGELLDLIGEVAHSFPRLGFGFRFLTPSDEQLVKLRSLLDHLEKSSEQPVARICA